MEGEGERGGVREGGGRGESAVEGVGEKLKRTESEGLIGEG